MTRAVRIDLLTRGLALLALASCSRSVDPETALRTIRAEDIRRHQTYLASDELEGRAAGSPGGRKAAAYISGQCERFGLRPGGELETYFQPFGPQERMRRNVIARRPGSDRALGTQFVVVGAHYDHLGRTREGICRGADDNASGSSTLLDVAEAVSKARFRRTIVCIWFDGEENNLEGSRHWTANPTMDLACCVAMINCDMIGRNDWRQVFVGVEKDEGGLPRYPRWAAVVREVEGRFGVPFDWKGFDEYIRRSDHWPFMEKEVPALFFTGGLHADYHAVGDTLDKINFVKEELVGRIVFALAARCAAGEGPLK